MFEISLVPDIKAVMLQKQKLRNLIVLICVGVAIGCGVMLLTLFSITGGQGIRLVAQDNEISCRSDGVSKSGKSCNTKDTGTGVLQFSNLSELLTIQDQMKNISILNKQKIKFSRIFGLLDVLLLVANSDTNTNYTVKISELTASFDTMSIYFDATATSTTGIGHAALDAFQKNAARSYFDYGDYMRYDDSTSSYVAIPSFCIDETIESGIVYGVYHKGNPGCEAPMVSDTSSTTTDGTTSTSTSTTTVEKKDIKIRRTYKNSDDREKYKNGDDTMAVDGAEKVKGYYFESSCLKYKSDDGSFDEASTIAACSVIPVDSSMLIGDSSYGKGEDGSMVLTFSASVPLNANIFLSSNRNMRVIGPSRQNVTDSYIDVRDMFTEKPASE